MLSRSSQFVTVLVALLGVVACNDSTSNSSSAGRTSPPARVTDATLALLQAARDRALSKLVSVSNQISYLACAPAYSANDSDFQYLRQMQSVYDGRLWDARSRLLGTLPSRNMRRALQSAEFKLVNDSEWPKDAESPNYAFRDGVVLVNRPRVQSMDSDQILALMARVGLELAGANSVGSFSSKDEALHATELCFVSFARALEERAPRIPNLYTHVIYFEDNTGPFPKIYGQIPRTRRNFRFRHQLACRPDEQNLWGYVFSVRYTNLLLPNNYISGSESYEAKVSFTESELTVTLTEYRYQSGVSETNVLGNVVVPINAEDEMKGELTFQIVGSRARVSFRDVLLEADLPWTLNDLVTPEAASYNYLNQGNLSRTNYQSCRIEKAWVEAP